MIRRREFVALLLGAAGAMAPLAAAAQELGRVYRLAILSPGRRDTPYMLATFEELGRFGFVENHNLTIDPGFDLRGSQFAERAAAMVKASPDAILAIGGLATAAAQQATRSVPIVGGADDMARGGAGHLIVPSRRQCHRSEPAFPRTGRQAAGYLD